MTENANNELAISLRGVTKEYRLGQIGYGSLNKDIQSFMAKLHGKEDPNKKLNARERLVGESFMALNGIDLDVKQGEALGIIGMNGAGKSTLLKLLCRVTAPTAGTIDIWGRISSMLEVGTGFHGEMTGRENVYMNGAILGMTTKEIDQKLPQIIEFSEVGDFIDTPVKRYSSGMYVKLAFSVAAHLDSEIKIMDEVLAVGDIAFQKKCLDKMKESAEREGHTVLYVSHNMDTIRRLCTRCIVMNAGKIIFDGDTETAIDQYSGMSGILKGTRTLTANESLVMVNSPLKLNSIALTDRDEPIYTCGEKIRVKIKTSVLRDAPGVSVRFRVDDGSNKPVGVMFDRETHNLRTGEYDLTAEMDTSQFAPGNYSVDIVTGTYDKYGANQNYAVAKPGLVFQIDETPNSPEHPIMARSWGHIRLNPLNVSFEKEQA